ncbi:MAG: hypothetical protein U0973_11690 [Xanthomonadaceae bacterium]|nr:hypothetical protein [Xanthomonadaceae bacterium]
MNFIKEGLNVTHMLEHIRAENNVRRLGFHRDVAAIIFYDVVHAIPPVVTTGKVDRDNSITQTLNSPRLLSCAGTNLKHSALPSILAEWRRKVSERGTKFIGAQGGQNALV